MILNIIKHEKKRIMCVRLRMRFFLCRERQNKIYSCVIIFSRTAASNIITIMIGVTVAIIIAVTRAPLAPIMNKQGSKSINGNTRIIATIVPPPRNVIPPNVVTPHKPAARTRIHGHKERRTQSVTSIHILGCL